MQIIVLRFDYKTSMQVEHLQKQVNAANPTAKKSLPPHITLQAYTNTNPTDLKNAIEPWAKTVGQISLPFASLGFFKQQGSFYLSPVWTKKLSDLHLAIHLATKDFTTEGSHYFPDQWVPHATVANNIAASFWGPLFARLSLEFEPFTGLGVAIECWSVIEGNAQTEWSIFLNE